VPQVLEVHAQPLELRLDLSVLHWVEGSAVPLGERATAPSACEEHLGDQV
jgi:hypothetical protein